MCFFYENIISLTTKISTNISLKQKTITSNPLSIDKKQKHSERT